MITYPIVRVTVTRTDTGRVLNDYFLRDVTLGRLRIERTFARRYWGFEPFPVTIAIHKGQRPETLCKHNPSRLYSWYAHDQTLCIACCDCGSVLKGNA